jgi:hypothetical protein
VGLFKNHDQVAEFSNHQSDEDNPRSVPITSPSVLRTYVLSDSFTYRREAEQTWHESNAALACQLVYMHGMPLCIVYDAEKFTRVDSNSLVSWGTTEFPHDVGSCAGLTLLAVEEAGLPQQVQLSVHGSLLACSSPRISKEEWSGKIMHLGWMPKEQMIGLGGPLGTFLWHGHAVEIAGVSSEGHVSHTRLDLDAYILQLQTSMLAVKKQAWLCASPIGPGRVAAVNETCLVVLRRDAPKLTPVSSFTGSYRDAIACFYVPGASELVIVFQNGDLGGVSGIS